MNREQCDVRRCNPTDSARLPQGGRANFGEFLSGFETKSPHRFVVDPVRNTFRFDPFSPGDRFFLSFDVALVFEVRFDLLPDVGREAVEQ